MFAIPNQSSIPMAYKQFTDAQNPDGSEEANLKAEGGSRLMPSGNRDRVVDCMEEFVKYTLIMRKHFDVFGDRYSERTAARKKDEQRQNGTAEAPKGMSTAEKPPTSGNGVHKNPSDNLNGVNVNGI